MTAEETYKLILYIIAKNTSQGYFSPADFNRTINQAQLSYMTFLLGTFQKYAPGRPVAPVEFGQNQVIRQRLTPAIYGYILNIDGSGFAPYPGDYLQTDAMVSIYGNQRIRAVQQDSLYSYVNSKIDPVQNNPIYLIRNDGFEFYPAMLNQAKLSYIRNPPNIVYSFTPDSNGRPVYDPATSVDPIWDDLSMFEIISRALAMIGVSLQTPAVMQYAQNIKQEGQ